MKQHMRKRISSAYAIPGMVRSFCDYPKLIFMQNKTGGCSMRFQCRGQPLFAFLLKIKPIAKNTEHKNGGF